MLLYCFKLDSDKWITKWMGALSHPFLLSGFLLSGNIEEFLLTQPPE